MTKTHDPRQVVEDLRTHLAGYDRNVAFLFGAGTSSSIQQDSSTESVPLIPGIDGMTEICRNSVVELGDKQKSAWERLTFQCESEGKAPNVENILSKLRSKIEAIGDDEKLVGLSKGELQELENSICMKIAEVASPSVSAIPESIPHFDFAKWIRKISRNVPIEVFTTNYDILMERSLEMNNIPVFDGFVGSFCPYFFPDALEDESLLPGPRWVRLWKLHGSVNWKLEEIDGVKRVIRTQPNASGEMIFPSHRKYDESRKQPYLSFMDRFYSVLNVDHSLLITCGYSFSDDHLNEILLRVLDSRSTANLVVLHYGKLDHMKFLYKAAIERNNLTVLAEDGAIISGLWGTWELTQPVDRKTYRFMDTAFDSNASPDASDSNISSSALSGRMRLGSFQWFCRFLNTMGGI